jgi:trimethylamine--corrinoid protein Co-methyltransferase
MRDVCVDGPGHYLGHGQTLDLMQKEYLYPDLANRFSPKEWAELGKPDIVQLAIGRKKKVLAEFFPNHVDQETDDWLRQEFNICLPKEQMRP